MVTPLKQQKDDWQTPLPITIGGVSSKCPEHLLEGVPGARKDLAKLHIIHLTGGRE
ncbi:MAG: hypothetical protein ACLTER_10430 [Ruminococcus sp.]